MGSWNPRYVHYARVHGHAPEAMLEVDRERWPGGLMCGFTLWIQARWREWDRLVGWPSGEPHSSEQGKQFDLWLAHQV